MGKVKRSRKPQSNRVKSLADKYAEFSKDPKLPTPERHSPRKQRPDDSWMSPIELEYETAKKIADPLGAVRYETEGPSKKRKRANFSPNASLRSRKTNQEEGGHGNKSPSARHRTQNVAKIMKKDEEQHLYEIFGSEEEEDFGLEMTFQKPETEYVYEGVEELFHTLFDDEFEELLGMMRLFTPVCASSYVYDGVKELFTDNNQVEIAYDSADDLALPLMRLFTKPPRPNAVYGGMKEMFADEPDDDLLDALSGKALSMLFYNSPSSKTARARALKKTKRKGKSRVYHTRRYLSPVDYVMVSHFFGPGLFHNWNIVI